MDYSKYTKNKLIELLQEKDIVIEKNRFNYQYIFNDDNYKVEIEDVKIKFIINLILELKNEIKYNKKEIQLEQDNLYKIFWINEKNKRLEHTIIILKEKLDLNENLNLKKLFK